MKKFEQHATFEKSTMMHDRIYRQYYFGGRVECFRKGVIKDSLNLYDVNSMYPAVMASHQHPTSVKGYVSRDITERTAFLQVVGKPLVRSDPLQSDRKTVLLYPARIWHIQHDDSRVQCGC